MSFKQIPKHIAIIMDGNRRWAEKRGLHLSEGHRAGAENVKNVVEYCRKYNVPFLTLFAFSTENWKRPAEEVEALMELLVIFVDKYLAEIQNKDVRITCIGRINELPDKQVTAIRRACDVTKNNRSWNLNLAINYGGRAELVDAFKAMLEDFKDGKLALEEIKEDTVSKYLYNPDIPNPDLLIRTSGEQRISNFLLWQLSYSELYFTKVLWPDFSEDEFIKALKFYAKRERRFGGR